MLFIMKCQKNKFKDKCDICGNFDYLKGINDKCLCPNCIKSIKTDNKQLHKKQLTIFDINYKK